MPRAKLRTPELAERILAGAHTLLADQGPAALTAREVAMAAGTSPAAIYELYGDKAGLVRALYLDGLARLAARLEALAVTADPRRDVEALLAELRAFARDEPRVQELVSAVPFAEFGPGPSDQQAAGGVYRVVVRRVRRAVEAGALEGDPVDIAQVLVALGDGLAARERAGLLGSSVTSANRRWNLAVRAVLDGLGPPSARPRRKAR